MTPIIFSRLIQYAGAVLRALGQAFDGFFAIVRDAYDTSARFERLARMSDADLARRGIRRDNMAEAIFPNGSRA